MNGRRPSNVLKAEQSLANRAAYDLMVAVCGLFPGKSCASCEHAIESGGDAIHCRRGRPGVRWSGSKPACGLWRKAPGPARDRRRAPARRETISFLPDEDGDAPDPGS